MARDVNLGLALHGHGHRACRFILSPHLPPIPLAGEPGAALSLVCRNKTPFHLFSVKSLCILQSSTKDNYFQHVPCMNAASKAELEFHHSPALCAAQRRREKKIEGERKQQQQKKGTWNWRPPGLTLIPRRLHSALAQHNTENEEAEETAGEAVGLKTNSL